MTTCDDVETWTLPRESNEWVGPIAVTKTDAATGVPVTDPVTFAVIPKGNRAGPGDYANPIVDPDGGINIGVMPGVVTSAGTWGIWAKVTGASEQPVLEPRQVGWIERT